MRSTLSAILFALVVGAFARPQGGDWSDWCDSDDGSNGPNNLYTARVNCLSDDDVQTLITGYTYLLEKPGGPDFNSTANAILSDQFTVYSDSINTLGNRTLGTPAWTSRQMFIATQSLTPPLPTVQTVDMFHNCDHISWRWNATGVQNPQVPVANPVRVQGLITFIVGGNKTIDTVHSEFNTAAFLTDLGNPECQQFAAQSN